MLHFPHRFTKLRQWDASLVTLFSETSAHYSAGGQVIIAADADYQFFRDCLIAAAKHGLQIHDYVWMTNHVHLLATPLFENSISKVFQSVGRKYVQYQFHLPAQRYAVGRTLPCDGGGKRPYLLTLMRYIELNPVRAGMTGHPARRISQTGVKG